MGLWEFWRVLSRFYVYLIGVSVRPASSIGADELRGAQRGGFWAGFAEALGLGCAGCKV